MNVCNSERVYTYINVRSRPPNMRVCFRGLREAQVNANCIVLKNYVMIINNNKI